MKLLALVQRQPKPIPLLEALLLVLLIGTIDSLSGYEMTITLFYGIPIMATIWLCGPKEGLLIAILCGITWWWADILAGHVYARPWLAVWEPTVRFVYFGFISLGGAALKDKHSAVQTRIALLEHSHRLEQEIIEISEREQRRIGRDLHDGLCQYLAAIGCAAGGLRADLLQQGMAKEAAIAEELTDLLRNSVVQTRDLARGLVPVPMDQAGLAFALDELAATVSRLQNIECRFWAEGEVKVTNPSAATHLYRIAQEAVHNATHHGRASQIRIELLADGDRAAMNVIDNGLGISKTTHGTTGLGLNIMIYRARLVGGHLATGEPKTGGTVITCTFPQDPWLRAEDEQAA